MVELTILAAGALLTAAFASFGVIGGIVATLVGIVPAVIGIYLVLTIITGTVSSCILSIVADGTCDIGAVAIANTIVAISTLGFGQRFGGSGAIRGVANQLIEFIEKALPPFANDYLTNAFAD